MKPAVYIETSVISYLTARMSRDLVVAAHQQITQDWWLTVLPKCDPYSSAVVWSEAARGDAEAARLRIEKIQDFAALELNDVIAH
jgi:hypothetical protein